MLKKQWFLISLIFALIIPFSLPMNEVKAESEWQKVDRQIKEIRNKQNDIAQKKKQLENQLGEIEGQQKNISKELSEIESDIESTENRKFDLESKIETTMNQAKEAAKELEEATKRVEERDQLLKTRVRLMYRKGDVQYLEVLLGSKNFSDFIQRFNALQKIINSDRNILQSNIDDKNMIVAKKKEIEQSLANLQVLYREVEELRLSLVAKKDERKVKMASLSQKQQEIEDTKEEDEELLLQMALREKSLLNLQKDLKYGGGTFAWPVPESKRITSNFGYRIDPITGKGDGHKGIDIGHAPGKSTLWGADIVAAADGIVLVARPMGTFGNVVFIDHGSDIVTIYAHIRNGGTFVHPGQEVKKGQKIAEVGTTGRSTGAHLHFEVRRDNVAVSPWDFLKDK